MHTPAPKHIQAYPHIQTHRHKQTHTHTHTHTHKHTSKHTHKHTHLSSWSSRLHPCRGQLAVQTGVQSTPHLPMGRLGEGRPEDGDDCGTSLHTSLSLKVIAPILSRRVDFVIHHRRRTSKYLVLPKSCPFLCKSGLLFMKSPSHWIRWP